MKNGPFFKTHSVFTCTRRSNKKVTMRRKCRDSPIGKRYEEIKYRGCTDFAARCYASAALAVIRCVSVRLSVTFVHSVKTNKHLPFFSTVGYSHIILVFPHQTLWQYSDGNPLKGASNAGGIKNHDFRLISRFISEVMQDRAIIVEGE